jgi:hypothetical protein
MFSVVRHSSVQPRLKIQSFVFHLQSLLAAALFHAFTFGSPSQILETTILTIAAFTYLCLFAMTRHLDSEEVAQFRTWLAEKKTPMEIWDLHKKARKQRRQTPLTLEAVRQALMGVTHCGAFWHAATIPHTGRPPAITE